MIKQNVMFSLLMIVSFSDISYASSDITPSQCIEDAFCPIIIGFSVVLLGVSFSNDYSNYVMKKNEANNNSSNLTVNSNIAFNDFGLNSSSQNVAYPVCFLNQTNKNLQKRCNQRSKEELKFLEKQSWDKLSPAAKKRYKYFQKHK